MSNNLKSLWDKANQRARERNTFLGLLGKHNPDTTVTIEVVGRPDYLWITLENKTVTQARNEAGVPQTIDLPIKLRLDHGTFVIEGRSNAGALSVPTPTPPSGVLPHILEGHSNVTTSFAPGDGDSFVYNESLSEWEYGAFPTDEYIQDIAGAMVSGGTETGIAVTYDDTNARFDFAVDTEFISDTVGAMVTGNTETDIAVTYQDADNTIDFVVSPTLVADRINAAAEQTTLEAANRLPLVDTDTGVVLKWISWTNHLASLVATALTWLANVTIASTATTGNALRVIRNLAAASTDAPVVDIVQDNAGDDQGAMRIQQDGTGYIIELLDGATVVLRVVDGGRLEIAQIIRATTSAGVQIQDDAGNIMLSGIDGGSMAMRRAAPLTISDMQLSSAFTDATLSVEAPAVTSKAEMLQTWSASDSDDFTGVRNQSATDGLFVPSFFTRNISANPISFTLEYETLAANDTGLGAAISFVAYTRTAANAFGALATRPIFRLANLSTAIMGATAAGNVGIGPNIATTSPSRLGIQAGSSTNDAAVGGVLYEDHVPAGQVGAGFDILATYTIPANTLAVNGQSIKWEAHGHFESVGETCTAKIEFGATTITTITGALNGGWHAEGRIFRVGATSQIATSWSLFNGGAVLASTDNPAETLSGAIVLKVSGDSTADQNNDVVCDTFIVKWDDTNT